MLGVGQQAQPSTEADIFNQWDQLLHLIEDRLDDSQNSIQYDIAEILRRLFPEGSEPLTQLLRLAQHSERMSDDEISSILSLDEVHGPDVPNTSTSTLSATRYYMRSIKLSVSDLRRALEQYRSSYFDHNYCDSFMAQIQDMRPKDSVWLRYIGCTFASTSSDRHMDDVPRGASPTRYNNFCAILQTTLGRPMDTRVFEFTRLNLQGQQPRLPMDRDIVDGIEIFLIHLFGRDVLLNSQAGGYYRSYNPTEQEKECTYHIDMDCTRPPMSTRSVQQRNITTRVQALLRNMHSQLRGYASPKAARSAEMLTDSHIDFIAQQATSGYTYQENVIPFTILGTEISLTSYHLQQHFFGGSHSGTITADMIKNILSMSQLGDVPFYDLWPLPSHHRLDDPDAACFMETAANLMRTLQAQVIVTLGYEAAVVAQSKFRDR